MDPKYKAELDQQELERKEVDELFEWAKNINKNIPTEVHAPEWFSHRILIIKNILEGM